MGTFYSLIPRWGGTSQLAEKCQRSGEKRQGTTSVVPIDDPNRPWALAPEGIYLHEIENVVTMWLFPQGLKADSF
jgi:hypothetical protein